MSHLQLILTERLGFDLMVYVESARSEGASYRQIAQVLTEETGITVSKSTVHYWTNK